MSQYVYDTGLFLSNIQNIFCVRACGGEICMMFTIEKSDFTASF